MKHYIGAETDCEALQAIETKAAGLPRRGHHVGGGIHVDLDGPERHGWTLRANDVRHHPEREEHAYPCEGTVKGVTASEAQAWSDKAKAAKELDASWTPKADPVGTVAAEPREGKEVER